MRSVCALLGITCLVLSVGVAADAATSPTVTAKIRVPDASQPCATAAGGRFVWVSLYGAPYLLKVDPLKNVVVGRTPIGNGSCGLGFGAGSLWIEDTSSGTVSRVSARSAKRIATIKVGALPYDATFAYDAAWVTLYGAGSVARIDPTTNRVVKRFRLSSATGVVGAFGSIWAAGADGVIRIDPQTNTVQARIPVPTAGWTAAGDDGVWVTTPSGLTRIDPTTNAVSATVAIAGPLGDPAVVAGKVWVPRVRANRIVIVEPASNAVAGTVKAGQGPFVVTEIRGEAWVPSWHGRDIWRFRP